MLKSINLSILFVQQVYLCIASLAVCRITVEIVIVCSSHSPSFIADVGILEIWEQLEKEFLRR